MELVRSTKDPEFDIDAVPLDDAGVYELLGRGDTMGVFQLESGPMRALLRSLAPTDFGDVAAVLALYRPGPMGVQHAQRLRRPQERPAGRHATSTPTPRRSWPTPTA